MMNLRSFDTIAESLAKLLHPHVEVVVHDIKSNSISAIYNPFSKRTVGDSSLIDDVQALAEGPDIHGPFLKTLADGRRLKYISTVLRDGKGEAVGLMCINFQLEEFDRLQATLEAFAAVTSDPTNLDSLFHDDWQRKIDTFVREYLRERNRSLDSLTRPERASLVRDLQSAGGFSARGAAGYIARVLGVSRATIYNDLGVTTGEGS
ncbi:MAG: hypothetical protein GY906_33945 [bacterium]|nr:hypothetical protein [bacterium]